MWSGALVTNTYAPNIVLTGFMGTGKTTVGKLVADMTGRPFLDTDDKIVERAGMSIPEIFVRLGEARFREIEKEVCRDLASQDGLVVATGGGMLVDDENRSLMESSALVVCLNAAPDAIEERVAGDNERPLLKSDWKGLLERRRAAYATISYQVDTTGKTPEQVAQEIVALLHTEWLNVDAPGGGYSIMIQPGVLTRIQRYIHDLGLDNKVVVVTNDTLAPLYAEMVVRALPNAELAVIPDGEQYKTLETMAYLYNQFVAAGLDRSGTVVALGGGVVGDTAGFAAATYMRGVRLVQIPTTLLSMVDSSVGGKVGVDLPQGKNMVGAFKQPDGVLIDTDVLRTLSPRQWRCGMAEVIKHGLLADEMLLDPVLHAPHNASELVRRAVQVKIDVVQEDPYEKGIRAHLNLGHTFGHAIEQASGYQWMHGEGVAIGLVAAMRLSNALGLCSVALMERVEHLLEAVGFNLRLDGLDIESIHAAMGTDKKRQSGKQRFILLKDIGQPLIRDDVPETQVLKVLESLR
jgi:shikimate kinase/3-dehydroquinate synthase